LKAILTIATGLWLAGGIASLAEPPTADYWVYVANESSDIVSLVRFGPQGASVERDIEVGIMPTDIEGAHGLSVEPGGAHFYVTLAHGTPFGKIWKIRTSDHALVDSVTLDRFPATIGITPDGSTAFVVNFNLHGDPVTSTVSAVFLPAMFELTRIEACVRPHGARVNHAGDYAYAVCVGDDQLIEISTERLAVNRRLSVRPGAEAIIAGPANPPAAERCGPTWVVPSSDDRALYVACNAHGGILDIDARTLTVTRKLQAGKGPYNLAATPDGRLLIVTNKSEGSVSVIDLRAGEEIARIATSQPVTHGVAVTPDGRYAFITNEAVGAVRGTVDVIDLEALARVASVEVHYQPGGIDFWKMEVPGR
jgi:DNA-binding beta-propeller fold protein YncE